MLMKGKFITIEGCEGVGKSTQLKKLASYLNDIGVDAVFTREPGGTEISEKIRNIILDATNVEMTPVTELLLYAAARRQHTEQLIIKAVNEGKVVVCDRYADSTMAYQGFGRNLDKQVISSLNALATEGVKIDLTLFLDLDPEKGFLRKGGADKGDRMENEKIDFHKRVYQGFNHIAKTEERVARIDASKSVDEVFEQIKTALASIGVK